MVLTCKELSHQRREEMGLSISSAHASSLHLPIVHDSWKETSVVFTSGHLPDLYFCFTCREQCPLRAFTRLSRPSSFKLLAQEPLHSPSPYLFSKGRLISTWYHAFNTVLTCSGYRKDPSYSIKISSQQGCFFVLSHPKVDTEHGQ